MADAGKKGPHTGTAFNIFLRDLKVLLRNPVALLVIGALLVLPGLYAWYCIVANWDPYSNTGNVPIAVVNQDRGAETSLTGEVNIGEQVAGKLHDNDSIDWRFYDDVDEALDDTRSLECYATIVLPADLSENVVAIFEGSQNAPAIYYYPNEKQNAVAVKVADSAAQTLVRQVNQQFSSTVNETILKAVQSGVDGVEGKAGEAHESAVARIAEAKADLAQVLASLDDATESIGSWRTSVAGSQRALDATASELPSIRTSLAAVSDDLDSLRTETVEFDATFSQALAQANLTLANLSLRASGGVGMAAADVSKVSGSLNEAIEQIKTLIDVDGESAVVQMLTEALQSLEDASSRIDEAVERANAQTQKIDGKVREIVKGTNAASKGFSKDVLPKLSSGTYELGSALSGLSSAIAQFEPEIASLQSVLSQADDALADAVDAIDQAKVLLSSVSGNLEATVTDLGALGSALEVDQISELLDVDPSNLGQFLSSPVEMVTQEVYPVSNYGTAVAPFYTNLALWIGCFILISLIKLEVDRRGFEQATPTQRYFGRWLLLVALALVQSQVICGVDILLGIDCANPALFMLAGAVCSFAYMNLLFALVITFRNVGKTLCILLLIMQVPGSSGMYPIEMMPGFFQFIHPALPFTYGIDAMREALCGMFGVKYVADLAVIALIVPGSLLIGLGLRPLMMNLLQLFDDEMRKAGFFASEEHGQGREGDRVRGIMRAVASHEAYRDDVEERAWAFRRRYPRLRRIGSVATFAVPFAFMLVALALNLVTGLTTDAKLALIVAMVIALLLVMFGLVVLEYMQRLIEKETRALGASLLAEDFGIDPANTGWDRLPQGCFVPHGQRSAPKAQDGIDVGQNTPGVICPTNREKGEEGASPAAGGGKSPALDIFRTDLRLGFQSVIGVVVVVLLVVTPSLYAWFNIAGSWDPYSSTGNLKVAVSNDDAGYKGELVPVTLNVGDTVVSQLRGNTSFNWTFVSTDEAIAGVTSGDYYAAIVIPDDFSRNMMTYLTGDAAYPSVAYYTNEKENPIAPIITQKGADSIQENIRASFTERVDEVGLTIASDLVGYLADPDVSGYVAKMAAHLDDATGDMADGAVELRSLSALAGTVSDVVSTAGVAAEGVTAAGSTAKGALSSAEAGVSSASDAFDQATAIVEDALSGSGDGVDQVAADADAALARLEEAAAKAPEHIHNAAGTVSDMAAKLKTLADETEADAEALADDDPGKADALKAAAELESLARSFADIASAASTAADHSDGLDDSISATRVELKEFAAESSTAIGEARSFYDDNVKGAVSNVKGALSSVSESTHAILGGLEDTVSGLSGSTGGLNRQLDALSGDLAKTGDKLDGAAARISDAKHRLAEALASGDVKQMQAVVLGADTSAMAARLAAPLEEVREPIYPVANYGSSMAPFYTVLSLWVGALVMISTMRVHVSEERMEELRERFGKVRPRHEFLGRYGIFGVVGLLQSVLVLVGDLALLHIQCVHPLLFILLGVFVGQVFCFVVYTITELFGDIGKALCVILLIMQVAASGGTFPIEMMSSAFAQVAPFLPFFHAMSLLQECVAGIDLPALVTYVAYLLLLVCAMLLIGVVVRRPFRIVTDWFEEQLEKTGYM